MKKWNDESLVKCLAGTLGDDFITEDEEVAEARLAFLEKSKRYKNSLFIFFFLFHSFFDLDVKFEVNNLITLCCCFSPCGTLQKNCSSVSTWPFIITRFSDALYYMLGCKVTQKNRNFPMLNSTSQQQLTNITIYRHKFILLLAKTGKIDQALNVSTVPGTVNLDKDVLTNTTPKGQLKWENKKLACHKLCMNLRKYCIIIVVGLCTVKQEFRFKGKGIMLSL